MHKNTNIVTTLARYGLHLPGVKTRLAHTYPGSAEASQRTRHPGVPAQKDVAVAQTLHHRNRSTTSNEISLRCCRTERLPFCTANLLHNTAQAVPKCDMWNFAVGDKHRNQLVACKAGICADGGTGGRSGCQDGGSGGDRVVMLTLPVQ
jgi:hypothetical protein